MVAVIRRQAHSRKPTSDGSLGRDARYSEGSPWLDPGRRGERLDLFDFPTFLLGRLSGITRRSLIPRYVEQFGLSIPEWRLLAFLAIASPRSFNEICAMMTMDRGQVSRTVPTLISKGLIERTVAVRKGPRRRGETERQGKLSITAKGRVLYRQVLPVAQRHQMVLLSALDESERDAFYRILQKVIGAAEQFEEFQELEDERHQAPRVEIGAQP